jgi:dihydroxyacetone kinase
MATRALKATFSKFVDAVLAGILAVTGKTGCLLIVKNYTGDRLNFGLAAERARAFGLKVSMVIVDDDIALPDLPQARGVAGTLFVHKIAGAMAEVGADLDTITTAARRIIGGAVSIGMSLDTCTVPGSPKEDRISAGKAELGLGIHGEAGIEQVDFTGARSAMQLVVEKLFFGRNVTTAITVGQARGVVLLAAALAHLDVAEYTPAEVKQAIAGYGNADKRQVQTMVQRILDLAEIPRPDDAADGVAIAVCHLQSLHYRRRLSDAEQSG